MSIERLIRTIPDYPKQGIMFRDVTTLFKDAQGLARVIDDSIAHFADADVDLVAGIEARGFITGAAIAKGLAVGFVPIRKRGKLPAETLEIEYELEYGSDVIEMHVDAVAPGQRILLVDDLIATGGTALAAIDLIERAGGVIAGCSFVVDLPDLGGSAKIAARGHRVVSLTAFAGE